MLASLFLSAAISTVVPRTSSDIDATRRIVAVESPVECDALNNGFADAFAAATQVPVEANCVVLDGLLWLEVRRIDGGVFAPEWSLRRLGRRGSLKLEELFTHQVDEQEVLVCRDNTLVIVPTQREVAGSRVSEIQVSDGFCRDQLPGIVGGSLRLSESPYPYASIVHAACFYEPVGGLAASIVFLAK